MLKQYKKLLKETERLQSDLMDITDYSEAVYQGLQATIDELEELIEEMEEN